MTNATYLAKPCRNARVEERGAVLIVSLVLLIIMMVGGVVAMRTTTLNEKATSNQRNKTISLMAAETGVTQFYNWFKAASATSIVAAKNTWDNSPPSLIPKINTAPLTANAGVGSLGYFWVSSATWNTTDETVSITVTGHALSSAASGQILSTSQIDVTFKAPGLDLIPTMPAAPLAIVGNVSSFNAATSNNFEIIGGSSPAIANTSASSTTLITNAIKSEPLVKWNNYSGTNIDGSPCTNPCIQTLDLGSTWGDAAAIQNLISTLQSKGTAGGVQYYGGNMTFGTGSGAVQLSNSTPVTIVQGTVTFTGNPADYTGLLIVLGGSVNVAAGGGNFILNGGLYLANINTSTSPWTFASSTASVTGGGGMKIIYNKDPANIVGTGSPMFQKWRER